MPTITPEDLVAARVAIRSTASFPAIRMSRLERLGHRLRAAMSGFADAADVEDLNDLTALLAELRHFTQFAEKDLRIIGVKSHYNPDGADQQDVAQRLIDALLRPRV